MKADDSVVAGALAIQSAVIMWRSNNELDLEKLLAVIDVDDLYAQADTIDNQISFNNDIGVTYFFVQVSRRFFKCFSTFFLGCIWFERLQRCPSTIGWQVDWLWKLCRCWVPTTNSTGNLLLYKTYSTTVQWKIWWSRPCFTDQSSTSFPGLFHFSKIFQKFFFLIFY